MRYKKRSVFACVVLLRGYNVLINQILIDPIQPVVLGIEEWNMSAVEQIKQLSGECAKHSIVIQKEVAKLPNAVALIKKWNAHHLYEAIHQEAVSRALKSLSM